MTEGQKAYLNAELVRISRENQLPLERLYNWDFSNTIERDDTALKNYLNQQNVINNSYEMLQAQSLKNSLEVTVLALPLSGIHIGAKSLPVINKVISNPTVQNVSLGLASNGALQLAVGQDFNWYEFVGAGVSGGITPKLTFKEAIRFNMGVGMGVGLLSDSDNLGRDVVLSGSATWVGSKVKNPILGYITSESIQKSPYLFNKEFINITEKDK